MNEVTSLEIFWVVLIQLPIFIMTVGLRIFQKIYEESWKQKCEGYSIWYEHRLIYSLEDLVISTSRHRFWYLLTLFHFMFLFFISFFYTYAQLWHAYFWIWSWFSLLYIRERSWAIRQYGFDILTFTFTLNNWPFTFTSLRKGITIINLDTLLFSFIKFA